MGTDVSILHPRVADAVRERGIIAEVMPCKPEWADTTEFCANYAIPPDEACNTILVALKKNPREYVCCLVRADSRLDVNHRLAAAVAFKRLSFASGEETREVTGMEIGGVALIGVPDAIPILIDTMVMEKSSIIVGGGNRTSKLRLDPNELLKLPRSRVADIALRRENR